MTQSDAPNEQLSNQEIRDLWEEYEAVMIRRWPPEEYGEDEDLSVLYSITEQFKTELLLFRDQLSKERELTKVLTQEVADLRVSNSLLIDNESKEREMRKDELKQAFNAGRNYQRGEMGVWHGAPDHDYPDFNEWYESLIAKKAS